MLRQSDDTPPVIRLDLGVSSEDFGNKNKRSERTGGRAGAAASAARARAIKWAKEARPCLPSGKGQRQ